MKLLDIIAALLILFVIVLIAAYLGGLFGITETKPMEYYPPSDKSYWAGFRAGLEDNCESDTRKFYNEGYSDCMKARNS